VQYEKNLIDISDEIRSSDTMYSLICVKGDGLVLSLNGVRCYLTGYFLFCLSIEDIITVHSGQYEAVNLQFLPFFYNVNLNHTVIGMAMYEEMRARFGYPDFHLFRSRDEQYFGLLHLSDNQYELLQKSFRRAAVHIASHPDNPIWSCETRSDIISIMRIAEGAFSAADEPEGNEILRFIHDNLDAELNLTTLSQRFHTNRTSLTKTVKSLTGMTPAQYILEERLQKSRTDLLFTFIPIADVAETYGFSDVNYYIRAFRKRFGKAPLQYRHDCLEERIAGENRYRELAAK